VKDIHQVHLSSNIIMQYKNHVKAFKLLQIKKSMKMKCFHWNDQTIFFCLKHAATTENMA